MSSDGDSTSKGTRKTIQINHDFFKIGKKGNKPIAESRKKQKAHPLKNNTIKQALAKRVQERKQKDLDDIYQRRSSAPEPAPVQTELAKSLSYLSEFVKNKKKRAAPSTRKAHKSTMKTRHEHLVNVDLPDELIPSILPAPLLSLVQPPFPLDLATAVPASKYTYSTVAPPYSNLKNSTGTKPTYRAWNHTRKRGGQPNPQPKKSAPSVLTAGAPSSSERERKLAAAKKAFAAAPVNKVVVTAAPVNKVVTAAPVNKVFTTAPVNNTDTTTSQPTTRIIKRTTTKKYTVGRKIGGRKISVLIKNIKTRKKIQDAKKALKKTGTSEIKSYLKSHGLLKGGSVAPNNVLREMYESAMMAGEVHNTNGQVALHNFNADDD
jgi:hypothetical protein